MAKEFFSGRTLQQAVLAAARRFGLDPDEVAYSERERAGGFIKNPKVVIEVDPGSPRRQAAAADPEPPSRPVASPAAPAPPPRPADAPRKPRSARSQSRRPAADPPAASEPAGDPNAALPLAPEAIGLLARLAHLDVQVAGRVGADGRELELELSGADAPTVTRENGELLEALEHLAPRVLRGLGAGQVLCRVDAAGFRASREERLRQLAREAAERVRQEGHPVSLPEMAPAERRIVHLALEGDPSVTTESQGDGFRKRVVVRGT